MALVISTTHGAIDESLLQQRAGQHEDAHERTAWVEYCWRGCKGTAHRTGLADAHPFCFCALHVHRTVHVTLKEWPEGLGAILGGLR